MIKSQKPLAILISSMHGGGAQRVTLHLARGLAECGYPVDLVMARAEGAYLAEVPETVRVVDLKASRVLTSLPALFRYLRRERPEAMLSAMNYVNIAALWARRLAGIPTRLIVSEHSTLSASSNHASSVRERMMPHFVRRFYPWADGIISVSHGSADDLARITGLPPERIKVIYNPVITPEVRIKAQCSTDHPWFKAGQMPVLLAIGRLSPEKDFRSLILAFAQVRKARAVRLLILGEGNERPALEVLVRQLGLEQDVSLPGFVQNPYALMACASAFVLSSRWEALPTVLIEALYCGAPLIATDCPSWPKEILANGKYGELVPPGDVAALAQAISSTLEKEVKSLPPESWKSFELETVVKQYVEVLIETNHA